MAVFELLGVEKRFGALKALEQIDLKIGAGERVVLVGPSGAGKSTLLSLLNGLQAPSQGEVKVLGQSVEELSSGQRRKLMRQIGTIYQQYHLVDNLAVIHNVNAGHLGRWSLAKALASLVWPQDTETAHHALEQVGIPEKLYARTSTLSGGQQQRVALARVIVQNPSAILADEPVASLDPERGREIMELLARIAETRGTTMVVSLHAVDFARGYFQRMVGLRNGRIEFDEPIKQVTDRMLAALYRIA